MRPLLTLLALLVSSAGAHSQTPDADALESLRTDMAPIEFNRLTMSPERTAEYFGGYGLDVLPKSHFFGNFSSNGFTLAAHAFVPENAHSTVIVLHGYLDHTGSHGATIQHLLEDGYAVAAYDQPGHGLSSGRRAGISDFAQYVAVFRDFVDLCRTHMPQPCHVVAHSTGATILVDFLLTSENDELGEVVLIAPLVHSATWRVSTAVTSLLGRFVDELPRVFRNNTSDKDYADFVRSDPLQPRRAAVDWFEALIAWNERVEDYAPDDRSITIIQGDEDSVVDWQYNLELLDRLFPGATIEVIEGGRHQLLNEARDIRSQVLQLVDEALVSR